MRPSAKSARQRYKVNPNVLQKYKIELDALSFNNNYIKPNNLNSPQKGESVSLKRNKSSSLVRMMHIKSFKTPKIA